MDGPFRFHVGAVPIRRRWISSLEWNRRQLDRLRWRRFRSLSRAAGVRFLLHRALFFGRSVGFPAAILRSRSRHGRSTPRLGDGRCCFPAMYFSLFQMNRNVRTVVIGDVRATVAGFIVGNYRDEARHRTASIAPQIRRTTFPQRGTVRIW